MPFFHNQQKNICQNAGFALFYAVVVMAVLSSLGAVLSNLIVRGSSLTATSRQSTKAFYAADAGMECALYWEQQEDHFPRGGGSVGDIDCAGQNNITVNDQGGGQYNFLIDSTSGAEVCADVTVNQGQDSGRLVTSIESLGRDTCQGGDWVERAIRTTY